MEQPHFVPAHRPIRIFISYSHDSDTHIAAVREFSDELRRRGYDAQIDQYATDPNEGWPRWMQGQLDTADFVFIVPTAIYLRRWKGEEEPGSGLGASWEGLILTNRLYLSQGKSSKMRCVIVGEASPSHIPEPLAGHTYFFIPNAWAELVRFLHHLPTGALSPTLVPCGALNPMWAKPNPKEWDRRKKLEQFLLERFTSNWELAQMVTWLPGDPLRNRLLGREVPLMQYVSALLDALIDSGELTRESWWEILREKRSNFAAEVAGMESMWR